MNETGKRPGCFVDNGKGVCVKARDCSFADRCLSAGVDRRAPITADPVPGQKTMEGGLPSVR